MPKINNPTAMLGKMIIRYKGANHLLLHQPTKMNPIILGRYFDVTSEIREKLVIKTELLDGTKVCFSLSSANLYTQKEIGDESKWETNEDNCAVFYNVNADKEQVIFEGSIHFIKELTETFSTREKYQVLLIFKNSKDLKVLLDQSKIEYNFHS